tara:strand:- start:130 stop:609 length:480 start_codon:yes stop_codon:yes gene_type:complete
MNSILDFLKNDKEIINTSANHINRAFHLSHINNRVNIQNEGLKSPLNSKNIYTGLNRLDDNIESSVELSNRIYFLEYSYNKAFDFLEDGGYDMSKEINVTDAIKGYDIDVWIIENEQLGDLKYGELKNEFYLQQNEGNNFLITRRATNQERVYLGLVEF